MLMTDEENEKVVRWLEERAPMIWNPWSLTPVVQLSIDNIDTINEDTPIQKILAVYWVLFVQLQCLKLNIPGSIEKMEIPSQAKLLNENNISDQIFNTLCNAFINQPAFQILLKNNFFNFECFLKSTEYVAQTLETKREGKKVIEFILDFITPKGQNTYYGTMSGTVLLDIVQNMHAVFTDIKSVESIWGAVDIIEDKNIQDFVRRRCTLLGFKLFIDCNFFVEVGFYSLYSKEALIVDVLDVLGSIEENLALRNYLKKDIVK